MQRADVRVRNAAETHSQVHRRRRYLHPNQSRGYVISEAENVCRSLRIMSQGFIKACAQRWAVYLHIRNSPRCAMRRKHTNETMIVE